VRHTLGARLSRPIAEGNPGWDFDDEALWQFGSFGSANIRAWTVASETGYRFTTAPLKPRFSAKADISSGDDPRTNTLGTFNPLFPKGNYFGVLATAGPGPINFIDVHPRVEATLPRGGVTVSVDWIFQWAGEFARRSVFRSWISDYPGGEKVMRASSDTVRARKYAGQANRHLWFQADYGIFTPGNSSERVSQAAT